MSQQSPTPEDLIVAPGVSDRHVRLASGEQRRIPPDWDFLPAGDAAITRRVKQGGPTWTVRVRRGRRDISLGLYAARECIASARAHVEAKRAQPAHQARLAGDRRRRDQREDTYREEFTREVARFLDFAPMYRDLGDAVAERVARHATPVGSGTVARTRRISIERRAEAALIAWMRHQTTSYDSMKIARVKGRRREVRRMLADQSRDILLPYRRGIEVDHAVCPLYRALAAEERSHARPAPAPPARGEDIRE